MSVCKRCGYDVPDQNHVNPDETCCVVADHLESSLSQSQAEVERLKLFKEVALRMETERNFWKSQAQKMAEALRHVDEMIEPIDGDDECNGCIGKDSVNAFVHDDDCDFRFIKEALAIFEKARGGE